MRLRTAIPPGTVQVWFGWRARAFEEGTYSELLVPLGGPETIDDSIAQGKAAAMAVLEQRQLAARLVS